MSVTGVAAWTQGAGPARLAVGTRFRLDGAEHRRTRCGRPAARSGWTVSRQATGVIAREAQEVGIRSSVGCPIVVGGPAVGGDRGLDRKSEDPFSVGTESQIARFTELVATAIANAEPGAQLAASRARVVAAADETRRRLERDLHDGAQQRLVSLALELRVAQDTAPADPCPSWTGPATGRSPTRR